VATVGRAPDDGTDHCVQSGAVTAAGQNPDSHLDPRSDVRWTGWNESRHIAGRYENGVDTGSLELRHVLRRSVVELRDRKLSRRHVVQKREQRLERIVVGIRIRREKEDPGVERFQGTPEIVGLRNPHHTLEPVRVALVPQGEIDWHDYRIRGNSTRVDDSPEMEQRELRGRTHRIRPAPGGEPVGALPFRGTRGRSVLDLDEDRDPVTLRDRLAELAHRRRS
jgi:hypothetical protein